MKALTRIAASFLLGASCLAGSAAAQDEAAPERRIEVNPKSISLRIGETKQIEARVLDAAGNEVDVDLLYFSRSRGALKVRNGEVSAFRPGEYEVVIRTPRSAGERVTVKVPVSVVYPPVDRIEITGAPKELFVGTTFDVRTKVIDELGFERDDLTVSLESSDPNVAAIDEYGRLVGVSAGSFTLSAVTEEKTAVIEASVATNPVRSIELSADRTRVRTGDVIQFAAKGLDGSGGDVGGAPIRYSFYAQPDDDLGPAATGQIDQDGRFVANKPGLYTIVASCGEVSSTQIVRADQRQVQRDIKLIGQGQVSDVHTSDLWVWTGVDGGDYAVTGTWMGNGEAIFWDVSDPADITRISTVTVDARTVNDVKISEDGRLCIISREGASNRRNGIVIIDVEDPRNPEVISTFDKDLTGGVHNLFIYQNHVFALSAARRYDIINIEDPRNPYRRSSFELDSPSHSIHDVWVVDGLAYSSNWSDGVWIVDVGNGVAGGSLDNPVAWTHYAYPSGWNHAAFPYWSKETGKFYVIAGDEAFPYGLNIEDRPTYARGWIHFIDFTDPKNPKEVARYEVPEAGTHNLWVEDDTLYVAYYNGGLRVVDISGDLMGNLYDQGREIGWFLPADPEGHVANAPMTWGPQPHKGNIFFSDWNSGLWAVQLQPDTEQ